MRDDSRRWIQQDHDHAWHPFTRQAEWCASDPLVLTRGEGVWLWDSEGRRYFDGNSSIWTNIHGHRHPALDAAVVAQLGEVAHTSYLGFANPRASELAARLCSLFPPKTLERVFFSDDGSTAIECAIRMALQYRLNRGERDRTRFVAFENAYHGDTLGAASLGGVGRFTGMIQRFGLDVIRVASLKDLKQLPEATRKEIAGVLIEPLIQGVNEMRFWPQGMLRELRQWCDEDEIHLILDEVMTGFGRTGSMFACQQEGVIPDFLCIAKGLTGGYLPMAATLTTEDVYRGFLGPAENAFYYGHSYTANPLGCAVALASLRVFEEDSVLEKLQLKIRRLQELLEALQDRSPAIRSIRQCGFIAGIELKPRPEVERLGEVVCREAWRHGLLTRPILDTLVLMPPLCCTDSELEFAVGALERAIAGVCH